MNRREFITLLGGAPSVFSVGDVDKCSTDSAHEFRSDKKLEGIVTREARRAADLRRTQ
jgi:hypothetical protein